MKPFLYTLDQRASSSLAGPPRSPNLTSCDFLERRFLKDRVYSKNVLNIQELKIRISDVFTHITDKTSRKMLYYIVWSSFAPTMELM